MWILSLDASTPRCVVALGRVSGDSHELVASDDTDEQPNQASARLMGRLQALTERAGIEPGQIERVACGRGPGTFTGTRVATATAKGIAVGLGCPVLAVSTLAALALSAGTDGLVLPLLDARRDEVYGALMRVRTGPSIEALMPERCAALQSVAQQAGPIAADEEVVPVGPGIDPYAEQMPQAWLSRARRESGPTAAGLWRATVAAHAQDEPLDPAALTAVYLRKSYAELGINAPKRPFVKSPFVE